MSDYRNLVDLASERLGGRAIAANDEFFAPKSNLLKSSQPIFIEGKFTSRGKWMDGWETRRRRSPGYDWCIIRLGLPGIIRGVIVDTSHFKGNYPARFSLEACDLGGPPYKGERTGTISPKTRWAELLPETALAGDSQNEFPVAHEGRFTHIRLKIYPDGGVARLRVHGEVVPPKMGTSRLEIDLASVVNGTRILQSSDDFFGVPLNLLMPGPGKNMGDGWETRRRRGPGHDWTILKLGVPGSIRRVEVDTSHFKGNFPESCSLETCHTESSGASDAKQLYGWKELLPRTKLKAHARHIFRAQLVAEAGPATHVRFNIYPDGGVSRLRLFGQCEQQPCATGIARLNELPEAAARQAFLDCCGSTKWASEMLALRPFASAVDLLEASDRIWAALASDDWLEAFRHHPPIGGKKAAKKQSGNARNWSKGEQARAQQATEETRAQLAEANGAYHAKFGAVFLICATGKTAEEILESARVRLSNDPDTERRIAAEEQRKITRLRLEKLLTS